jgi:hypothetical protein
VLLKLKVAHLTKAANSRSDSNMSASKGNVVGTVILLIALLAALIFFSVNIGRGLQMKEDQSTVSIEGARFVLKPYTGTGSGVYKHSTIVTVDDNGNPTVVGNFNDESGKLSAGTVELVRVK